MDKEGEEARWMAVMRKEHREAMDVRTLNGFRQRNQDRKRLDLCVISVPAHGRD